MLNVKAVSFLTLIFLVVFGVSTIKTGSPTWASATPESEGIWLRFSQYDENSTTTINHDPLIDFLDGTVLPVGRSKSRLGRTKAKKYRESHIVYGNTSPSRFEGNRVMYHAFSEDHTTFIKAYIEGMENLSRRRPITTLKHDEQLAFWLNLHNLLVMDLLIQEYPIRNLQNLRLGSGNSSGAWEKKVVTIEDVQLSIRDIEMVVMKNWNNPTVIYGLFQGSIGGPSLPNKAFTAENVWQLLNKNAVEFVNSNRGVRPKGSKAKVSEFYEWNMIAFDGSDDALIQHINNYADQKFLGNISGVTELDPDYYDWIIADFLGGSLHSGRYNQLGGVLSSSEMNLESLRYFQQFFPIGSSENIFPPQTLQLLEGLLINNDVPYPVPTVSVEECGPDECNAPESETEQY